jgi:DNA-binding response OmpR family regulator
MPVTETGRGPIGRVLVSDAGPVQRDDWVRSLSVYLEPRSVQVERVFTGRDAIGLVERGGIDAAILSSELPAMDGLSVLRIIRSLDSRLPCVMIVGDASKRTLQQALELQAYSVLIRPVDVAALRRVVTGLFRKYLDVELD